MDSSASHERAFSRSTSPDSDTDCKSSTDEELPLAVKDFFQTVSQKGFPSAKAGKPKVQPWKGQWDGPQESEEGKLIVACPRICTYGSGNLGGW